MYNSSHTQYRVYNNTTTNKFYFQKYNDNDDHTLIDTFDIDDKKMKVSFYHKNILFTKNKNEYLFLYITVSFYNKNYIGELVRFNLKVKTNCENSEQDTKDNNVLYEASECTINIYKENYDEKEELLLTYKKDELNNMFFNDIFKTLTNVIKSDDFYELFKEKMLNYANNQVVKMNKLHNFAKNNIINKKIEKKI